jgi:hypothetical protein
VSFRQPKRVPPYTLPSQISSFVGREAARARLIGLLDGMSPPDGAAPRPLALHVPRFVSRRGRDRGRTPIGAPCS